MKYFAQMCSDLRIGQHPAAQLPWFHLVTLLTKIDTHAEFSRDLDAKRKKRT